MPIVKSPDRQKILVASKIVTFADLASGVAQDFADIPVGATVIGGGVAVTLPFDSVTTDLLDVGDSDPNRYSASPIDLSVAGYTALTVTGFKYLVSTVLNLEWTQTGGSTTEGQFEIQVWYTIEGRGEEIQT